MSFFPLPNEMLWAVMLLLNFFTIILLYRTLGKVGLYVWIPISVILANIQVLKTVELFGLTATLGNIVYASSFLVTDILSENYGKEEAKRAVWIGFFAIIVMTVMMNLALYFSPADSDFAQSHLEAIFSMMPRIAFASLTAYLLSQIHDIWAYDFWKRRFPSNRYIWLRNNASTMISQLIDSIVFVCVAFWGEFEMNILIEILLTTYFMKWIVAIADTPFIYMAKNIFQKQ